MEGAFAVGGFGLLIAAIICRKSVIASIEKFKVPQNQDAKLLEARVQQLEHVVADLSSKLTELKSSNDFSQRIIIDSAKKLAESHKLLIESTKRFTASQKSDIRESSNVAASSAAASSPHQLVR